MISMDSWTVIHARAAASQGWLLSEVDHNVQHQLEIQRVDDAMSVSQIMEVAIPQLEDDQAAVYALQRAWMLGEDHALLAVSLLREMSPSEYAHWGINNWIRPLWEPT